MKIDIVIPWVDGNDTVLNEKRRAYCSESDSRRLDIGGGTRYSNMGEIDYCIRSINRFAPFINRIFIVSDGQDPKIESNIPVSIIDHKVIFEGYEEFLPTFNSTSIETLIHRIPGLSEHYILMNDDFVIIRDVTTDDFFLPDGKAVCYTRIVPCFWARFLDSLAMIRDGYRRVTFKRKLLKGCRMQGKRHPYFFYLVHTPRPQLKSVCDDFFSVHPEAVTLNIRHKFRNPEQYQVQALTYMIMWDKRICKIVNPSDKLLFIQHWEKGLNYVKKKFRKAKSASTVKFACFNSLDQAAPEIRKEVFDQLEAILSRF